MKICLLTWISCFLALCLFSQDTVLLKRTPYKLTIAVNTSSFYEENIQATPYILQENVVQLYPGEAIFIEVEQDSGHIKSFKAVKDIHDSSKTLILSFTQTAKEKVHGFMMLKITNPFPYELVYGARIYLLLNHKWVDTDVVPVRRKFTSFETWPDVITSIALGEWTFQPE